MVLLNLFQYFARYSSDLNHIVSGRLGSDQIHTYTVLIPLSLLSCLFWLFYFRVIILVSQMPSYAGTRCYCSKLVNDVTRDEVDIIISQPDGGIFDTFSSQLVKFCIIHPANTLK